MRELSEQETESVSGGASLTTALTPISVPFTRFDGLHYGRLNPVPIVPEFNLNEIDFFSNQPDS